MTFRSVAYRVLAMVLGSTVLIYLGPGLAEAKGGGPLTSYVAITGPGLNHPWVLHATGTAPKGYRGEASELFTSLATRLGMLGEGASAKAMEPPDTYELGTRYDVYFFRSCLGNFGRCRASVHEVLYPLAAHGAVAYLAPGQERVFVKMFGRQNLFHGWFGVFQGNVVQEQLLALGASRSASASAIPTVTAPSAIARGVSSYPLIAVGAAILPFVLLAVAYRARRRIAT